MLEQFAGYGGRARAGNRAVYTDGGGTGFRKDFLVQFFVVRFFRDISAVRFRIIEVTDP